MMESVLADVYAWRKRREEMVNREIGRDGSGSNGESADSASSSRRQSPCLFLTDSEALDCCICYEPLTVPVFQCPNCHLVCASCHSKVDNICPFCRAPIGHNRSRAIEKILESVKIRCQNAEYGCTETLSYNGNRDEHETRCFYAPCFCPFSFCGFIGSCDQLGKHVDDEHDDFAARFDFIDEFKISIRVDDEYIVLRELETNTLFLLHNTIERAGNVISVCHIAPAWFEDRFLYKIKAKSGECLLKICTSSKSIERRVDNPPSNGYLVVPSNFAGSDGKINLYIRIRENPEWLGGSLLQC